MKKFVATKTEDNKPDDNCCNDKIKETISYDESKGEYIIPQDLLLDKLPQDIVDSFLDFLNSLHLNQKHLSMFLEMIKKGEITIACGDED